jgi:ribosomal protein S18 acetylase RimI-like enzyme
MAEHPLGRNPLLSVAPATRADKHFIATTWADSWGGPLVAGHGELIDLSELPALVAQLDGEPAGLLTYRRTGADPLEWEITSVDATIAGAGVGTALLDAVAAAAAEAGVRRLWLVTSNENTHALRFYQRRGYDLVAVHRNAVDEARRLKPGIPLEADGIPIHHELELERLL